MGIGGTRMKKGWYCAPAISRALALMMAAGAVVLDQLGQQLAQASLESGDVPQRLTPWLTLAPGASGGTEGLFLTALLVALIVAVGLWLFTTRNRMQIGPIGLLLGGVAATLGHRLQTEGSFGFLDLHAGAHHLPLLGVGEGFVLVGAVLLLLTSVAPRTYAYCEKRTD